MVIQFEYENHRHERALRTVEFYRLEYLDDPGYGYSPGWFITGFCHTKQAERSFSLGGIILGRRLLLDLTQYVCVRK